MRIFRDFGSIWEAPGLPKIEDNQKKSIFFSRSVLKGGSGRVLGGFWEDLGRVLGGFGCVLGRFWMDFGKILFLSPASHLERHV